MKKPALPRFSDLPVGATFKFKSPPDDYGMTYTKVSDAECRYSRSDHPGSIDDRRRVFPVSAAVPILEHARDKLLHVAQSWRAVGGESMAVVLFNAADSVREAINILCKEPAPCPAKPATTPSRTSAPKGNGSSGAPDAGP